MANHVCITNACKHICNRICHNHAMYLLSQL
jgi:hypothetical protein